MAIFTIATFGGFSCCSVGRLGLGFCFGSAPTSCPTAIALTAFVVPTDCEPRNEFLCSYATAASEPFSFSGTSVCRGV